MHEIIKPIVEAVLDALRKHLKVKEYKLFIFSSYLEDIPLDCSDIDISILGQIAIDSDFTRVTDSFKKIAM